MALAEARAAGLSVISADVGAVRELGTEVVGFNAREIADKILEKLS